MNAAVKVSTSSARNFRERSHKVTKMPVKDIIKTQMEVLGLKNTELAKELGFPMPNVVAMIKGGSMRLPVKVAIRTAEILKQDPSAFLLKVIDESDPELGVAIRTVFGKSIISDNEMKLIEFVRTELDGFDTNVAELPEFAQATKPIIKKFVTRQRKETDAFLEAIDRK